MGWHLSKRRFRRSSQMDTSKRVIPHFYEKIDNETHVPNVCRKYKKPFYMYKVRLSNYLCLYCRPLWTLDGIQFDVRITIHTLIIHIFIFIFFLFSFLSNTTLQNLMHIYLCLNKLHLTIIFMLPMTLGRGSWRVLS